MHWFKVNRPYVVLVLISMMLSGLVLLVGLREISTNNHKFCQVLAIHLKDPITKPVGAAPNSQVEREWELKLRRASLARQLGC